MRRNKLLLGVTCLTAGTAMFAGTAHADRRTGLAGNLLIQDPDDLFPFPQYTLTHRNMIRLDYGGASTSGNGVLTMGDENMAFGVAVHRGDVLSPDVVAFNQELVWLGGVGNPFGDSNYAPGLNGPDTPGTTPPGAAGPVLPTTVFDVVYGRKMGDDLFGARLGFGRGVQSVDDDGDVTKGSNMYFAGQVGYSLLPPEDGVRLDMSANLVIGAGKSTAIIGGDEEDVSKGLNVRSGLLIRGYQGWNQLVDLAFLGNASFEHEKTTNEPGDDKSTNMAIDAMGGFGPAIHTDRATIAAYGGFVFGFDKDEPSDDTDDDEVRSITYAAPMVNMAAEVQLFDWMYVRTGAQYTWGVNRVKTTPGGDDAKERTTNGFFNWSAGLGLTKNNFYFDGVISDAFVTNGPAFIGGNDPGFLAMASVTYKFGDVFSGVGTPAGQTAPVVEPAPVAPAPVEPAPPVEPEPTQEAAPPAVDTDTSGAVDATGTSTGTSASGSAGASGSIGVGR